MICKCLENLKHLVFASHAPERFVFATHVSERFGCAEMCGSLLRGCSLGWGRSPYRIVGNVACVSFVFCFRFESVAYRTPPRALVKFVMHTLSKESLKHSLNF